MQVQKALHMWKKFIFEILLHKVLKMVNIDNWQNFNDNLVSTCDEVIEETKKVTRNFDEKNAICKKQNFYILLAFLLITTKLLKAVNTYC